MEGVAPIVYVNHGPHGVGQFSLRPQTVASGAVSCECATQNSLSDKTTPKLHVHVCCNQIFQVCANG
mgnify:CR=1 FL=1